ncbi:hypothetical protein G6L63_11620 [Agrobacterium vitis]|uniref:hypothetical protein n=1 Tax=Agrobacterium vitis TaxID=373 RepID=UPI0011C0745A|nr:hypothetical protein [Agrobacterium vitis]NOJ33680.1 hypothetical protein [Agrobacterium vitis]NSZ48558.1 hypothetical protein [Agrobacterium vitis]UJL73155.1 hypothetical protein AVCG412_10180 [Agrobacterium vitis]
MIDCKPWFAQGFRLQLYDNSACPDQAETASADAFLVTVTGRRKNIQPACRKAPLTDRNGQILTRHNIALFFAVQCRNFVPLPTISTGFYHPAVGQKKAAR